MTAPLTFEQDRYVAKIHGGGWVHKNVWHSFEILGDLDREALLAGLDAFVRRHDAMRVELLPDLDAPVEQRDVPVADDEQVAGCQHVTAASTEQFSRYASVVLSRDCLEPWSGGQRPFRFRLLRYDDRHHALLATFQQVVFDGRAHEVFARELWRDYAAILRGDSPPTTASSFLAAARQQRATVASARTLADWRDRLEFAAANRWRPPAGTTPTDNGVLTVEFPAEAVAALRAQCAERRCSLQQWVIGAFARATAAAAGRRRLTLWTTMDTRPSRDRDMVGMFAGSSPLALDDLHHDLPHVVTRVRGQLLTALRHQGMTAADIASVAPDVPAAGAGEEIHVHLRSFSGDHRDTGDSGPLRITAAAYPLRRIVIGQTSALHLDCYDYPDHLRLRLRYRGDVVGRPLAQSILDAVAADMPDRQLTRIS
ncbi:condensation domain-containing protein [Kutzneria sp. CA-103260]|uniref:condensation domain-containing protein n=1 Tax=Kutzneria sp. CA-103260 TaxID=2802641 RepID=UPI002012E287|nr:condensation domain-containing protein [Kutzneria sp. CA-103260]